MKTNDIIVVKAGKRVGMGKLRKDVLATILRVEQREDGTEFYTVQLEDGRFTHIDAKEATI